ncbi:MAG: T9SS type A sorting domain-containing protein [Flavipsychrobacter sp.]|nr:T9SS type A sorting domain-containing protein [Flavipsychrobacter sp.]
MKTRLLYLLALMHLLLPVTALNAQVLEQVDLSAGPNFNTYLTGINNSGYVTGYFNNGFNNYGFIITPSGKRLVALPTVLGYSDTKVESINDNGVAVVTCNTGSTVGIFRCYLDTLGDSIHHYVQVTGLTQPSSVAFDINNNNDISGWFQASTRFLWVKHDSIVPTGNIPFESNRVEIGIDVYNTLAGGINDANKVAGFYIDGSLIKPFVYDNITENFTYLNSAFKIRLWDINNNNWVAGEYLQTTNNVYMGFIANASTGSLTQFTSMNTIFDHNGIQSVANAINDNGDVVGSFYHPDSNHWVGFIYRPGVSELRIPGFSFADDTWSLENAPGVANTSWPATYWSGFDYTQTDPYVPGSVPLLDNNIMAANPSLSIPSDWSVDWPSFAKETDVWGFEGTTNPFTQAYYYSIGKHLLFNKFKDRVHPYWGNCYGITYSELLRYFDDQLFQTWYGVPAGTNTSQVSNADNDAIQAIARNLLKQKDQYTSRYSTEDHYADESLWSGLHEMKSEFLKPFSQSNPRTLSYHIPAGYHSVLPYKVRTPKTLPFDSPTMEYDTVFIHDSNNPTDSTIYILVGSYKNNLPHTSASYPGEQLDYVSLNKISVRELMNMPMTQLKSTSAGDDPILTLSLSSPSQYTITTGTGQAILDGSGYANSSTDLTPVRFEAEITADPSIHLLDTNITASFNNHDYTNGAMNWTQSNKAFAMTITRASAAGETDNGEAALRRFSYGNPDNNTKYLNCTFVEMDDNLVYGSNIIASGICAAQGDSIVTSSLNPYTYTISKVSGTGNCIYDLTVFASYNGDTVKEFHAQVSLDGATTHTIDPYFQGTNGTQIAVIVDNGNDGSPDDTLFVAGWPVGVTNVINREGVKAFPNPVQNDLAVEFAHSGTYTIQLTDIVGRAIHHKTVNGSGKVLIPMAQYPAGMYLLQVADEKGNILLKDKVTRQ